MKVFLSPALPNKAIAYYSLQLVAQNKGFKIEYTTQAASADAVVGTDDSCTLKVSTRFYELLAHRETAFEKHLDKHTKSVLNEDGSIDYLSTIFYYVNCVQEFYNNDFDQYGRFPYTSSLQYQLGNTQQNFVQQLIDELVEKTAIFKQQKCVERASAFFLTHDIDDIFKARNEDGKYALLKGKWLHIFRLLWNHYLATPDLLNMEKIVALEQQLGFRSTFFWLPIKSKKNADYEFASALIQKQYQLIARHSFSNGIHKAWNVTSFEDEMKSFAERPTINRYHFLKFTVADFAVIEDAKIEIDTSLGFAEQFGFRNNYGLPFHPFSLENNKVHSVLEVPMQVMDRTFYNQKKSPENAAAEVLKWMEINKQNCLFTINWHNNFFTDLKYHGYREFYQKILMFFKEREMRCYTPDEIKKDFFCPDFFTLPEHLR